ncbi:TIGR03915 family putative DNA repair protein [Olivibacter sp. SDN3]|uniref:TIGR03915 family putative DNA repair protein n=1 Tax=Olivibacter sp. SDN3 TaxID=2764720 RepID=UPI0016516DD6|nr:TIGR03915 family putative DNA repair protein [Olivibacter sp. SDN3]QNL49554.1 TIGR03915 family putative DNA repair protein [Olivibacter sp. SDN3]
MSVWVYDGSWKGLLTLVFEAFEYKKRVDAVYKEGVAVQVDLFGDVHTVITNGDKAQRMWTALAKRIPSRALGDLYRTYLSEIPQIEVDLCSAVNYYFDEVDQPYLAYGRKDVLTIRQTAKMVDRERHRMKAFVRFKRQQGNLYFAVVEPDFNVLPLLQKHFSDRYADQQWCIYDLKRGYGIFYNLKEVQEITIAFSDEYRQNQVTLEHEEEALYEELWQRYFKHVNVKERKNMKLHVQHVPKRYWKYLTEKRPT